MHCWRGLFASLSATILLTTLPVAARPANSPRDLAADKLFVELMKAKDLVDTNAQWLVKFIAAQRWDQFPIAQRWINVGIATIKRVSSQLGAHRARLRRACPKNSGAAAACQKLRTYGLKHQLVNLLMQRKDCIIERYETDKSAFVPPRDRGVRCADGAQCSLKKRIGLYGALKKLAVRGDANAFYKTYRSAHLIDCFSCSKHNKWHTKHVHCTQDCGGNNGIFKGPCFETCKAGHDFNQWAQKAVKDVAREVLRPAFHAYIEANRAVFLPRAQPLTPREKAALNRHFPRRIVDKVRVLEHPRWTGFFNFGAGATTYGELVIVRRGQRSVNLLKHELVHVCQYDRHGRGGFARQYADQYVNGGFSYRNIAFEKQAFNFQRSGRGPVSGDPALRYCR